MSDHPPAEEEALRDLLQPHHRVTRPRLDTIQRLRVVARRRRRRRALLTGLASLTVAGIAAAGTASVIDAGPRTGDRLVGPVAGASGAQEPTKSPDMTPQLSPEPSAASSDLPRALPPNGPPALVPVGTAAVPEPPDFVAAPGQGVHAVTVYRSSDGKRLRDLVPLARDLLLGQLSPDRRQVYVEDLAGCGRRHSVVSYAGGPLRPAFPGVTSEFLSVSPAQDRLATITRPAVLGQGCGNDKQYTLVIRDLGTGKERRWTEVGKVPGIYLEWRPDEQMVAFVRYGETGVNSTSIAVLDVGGAGGSASTAVSVRALGVGCELDSPQWTPQGRLAALEKCSDGTQWLDVFGAESYAPLSRTFLVRVHRGGFGVSSLDLDASGQHALLMVHGYGASERDATFALRDGKLVRLVDQAYGAQW